MRYVETPAHGQGQPGTPLRLEGVTFERQARLKKLATRLRADVQQVFTESLILAQDERWRRA